MQKIAVVMLTMNQRGKTLRALESFRSQKGPPFEVFVWDNGSEDGTCSAIQNAYPEVVVHFHSHNVGVASGRNAGAALAIRTFAPSHLLFIDNDMIVEPGFIQALAAPFNTFPRLAQTQGKLRFLRDPLRLNDGGGCRITFWLGRTRPVGFGEIDHGQYDHVTRCIACGGAMMVRTDVFQELAGFDNEFDPFGPEDLDFSLRAYKQGYFALYVPQAVAYHEVSHSFEGGKYTSLYARTKVRHWLTFMRRHASLGEQLGFFFYGAPYRFVRAVIREAKTGSFLAPLSGVHQGLRELFKPAGRTMPASRKTGERW